MCARVFFFILTLRGGGRDASLYASGERVGEYDIKRGGALIIIVDGEGCASNEYNRVKRYSRVVFYIHSKKLKLHI